MIKFNCKSCGQKFSVPAIQAGKKGRCPKCKKLIIVPKLESTSSISRQSDSGDAETEPKYSDYDLSLLDVPHKHESQNQQAGQYDVPGKDVEPAQKLEEETAAGETEPVGKRKLPWPVDIYLYPTSKEGLITIVIILLLRILTDIVAILLSFVVCIGGILGLIVKITIAYSYMYWYFSECISDSAAGGVRAPETIGNMSGLGEMIWQLLRLFACYAFFLGPVTFYRGYTFFYEIEINSIVFWSLLTYGVFFFPIGILAVVMFDSVNGLNPILLIRSIFSTLVKYCGLVILFYGLGILFFILRAIVLSILPRSGIISYIFFTYICFHVFSVYALLILGHLIGRFYWRYQEKLNWEV